MEQDEDGIPPLEDFSEVFASQLNIGEAAQLNKREFLEPRKSEEKSRMESVEKLLGTTVKASTTQQCPESEKQTKGSGGNKGNFGGFKKGFLSGQSKNSKPKPQEQMTTIRPKSDVRDSKVLPEVQEFLKATASNLDPKDWLTDDLVKKIQQNPRLGKYLSSPNFSKVLDGMQSDPEKYHTMLQSDPEMMEVFREFCGLMGDHFTNIGSKPASSSPTIHKKKENVENVSGGKQARQVAQKEEDDAKVQEIINDPEIQEIFKDTRIQELFASLRQSSPDTERILRTSDADLHRKIKRLMEKGLLSFSS